MSKVTVTVVEKDPEQEAQRRGVYVMTSFLVPAKGREHVLIGDSAKRQGYEEGVTMLWETLEDVEEYLQVLREGKDDRPFEMRWNILCVEKVYFGPYSHNEVIGWWRATQQDNNSIMGYDLEKLDKCPLPDSENCFNFTIGT